MRSENGAFISAAEGASASRGISSDMAVDRDSGGCRNRAISALVQHAKATFEKNTCDTRLVAPISPSPEDLIHT